MRAPEKDRPFYGLDRLAANPKAIVILGEGEKVADALAVLYPKCVAMAWPGGCKALNKVDIEPLRGRKVVYWPDADEPGVEAAESVRLILGPICKLVVIAPPEGKFEGWDAADALEEGWTPEYAKEFISAAVQSAIEAAKKEKKLVSEKLKDLEPTEAEAKPTFFLPTTDEHGVTIPAEFTRREDGYYFRNLNDKQGSFVCGPMNFLAQARNPGGDGWALFVEVRDEDGSPHRVVIPCRNISRRRIQEVIDELNDLRFRIATSISGVDKFVDLLNRVEIPSRATFVSRTGYHQDSCYVLSDETIGDTGAETILLNPQAAGKVRQVCSGTVGQWNEKIAAKAAGNALVIFSISFGFAGYLLAPARMEGGGFHIAGSSSTGKSTLLYAASSVTGPRGEGSGVRSWRQTLNGLEGTAARYHHCSLVIDEIGQSNRKDIGDAAYMLANGIGKIRANKDGSSREAFEWVLLFLSSGEPDFLSHLKSNGEDGKAGQEVRILAFLADAGAGMGAFHHIHGAESPAVFADQLKRDSQQYYGAAGRAFIEAVTANFSQAGREARYFIDEFKARVLPKDADGQMIRAAERFGLVAAAGELATKFAITESWQSGMARDAVAECFKLWVDHRGFDGPVEIERGVRAVLAFIEKNGSSRFESWDAEREHIHDKAGWRRRDQTTGDTWRYYFTSSGLNDLLNGFDRNGVLNALADRGILTKASDGKFSKTTVVPGEKPRRLYVIDPPEEA